ncbi:uncharacterized protein LOC9325260 [Arabidopsis lyrata subsp. lyrata]|uniref:uncharacterized protein LOC9325260 n=1 Tax=Arabidopsis lyrata subsp. lyrata TaxID=81972 RepID=UPI000A29A329|nr:uncharacterized protein LOC9325260 [Arabidopsis lyrata subsp. lyrata]|eukprot:XP_020890440.1 uncharacterized protein LOC9325260 [Arabidopsis lyrata subsp. lyrata]
MAGVSTIETEKYSLLEDFSVDVEVDDEEYESFSLCFWVYLLNSTTFPSTIIRQVHSDMSVSAPFLVLDENKKMMLLPLTLLHKEAPDPVDTSSWTQVPSVSTKSKFPLQKWVHVGCEVSRNFMRLFIDGNIEGEQFVTSLLTKNTNPKCPRKISLFSVGGDGYSVQGFIQCAQVLPASDHVEHHYMKDPPLLLSVNKSSSSGIKLDDDGVWQASCREIFSLDVVLSNAIGQPVHKDVEVVASLLYADTLVEARMSEAEAPLLVRDEGVEFSSGDRPIKLLNGRSSFKLKISQLSSKSDNRLFWIKFGIRNAKDYPFLQAVSNPIRCISISPDVRPLSVTPKRLTNIDHLSSTESPDLLHNASSVKRIRLGKESVSGSEESYQQCNSRPQTSRQFENGNGMRLHEEDNSSTDSENSEMRYTISDSTIFRYCLGNIIDKSLLLKEITNNSSDDEVLEFANQVSLYSGCSHHSYQINMARELIAEGTNAWILISRNNQHVLWDNVVYEIEEHFMRISKCSSRSLTHQDFELLRRISGCYEYVTQVNFEKMWCWLFPVAYSISRGLINGMWRSSSPKWIEGFITKEEAEHSLQGQEPGTFILRFPISRIWPHPDAGSLVVSYVGHDFALHHKQLKIDNISSERYMDAKPLQDVLLAEPELSRLGRIIRSH